MMFIITSTIRVVNILDGRTFRGQVKYTVQSIPSSRRLVVEWREDSADITRILLTTVADPLARQGAKMSDTITLCTKFF